MRRTIMVGCPVWRREWVLPNWFLHTERACFRAGVQPHYVFVADPKDIHTTEVIFGMAMERDLSMGWSHEDRPPEDARVWNHSRFKRMVELRNQLLRLVREQEPEFFLSLDSDILLAPDVIGQLLESSERFDAVGGKTFMEESGTSSPSFAMASGAGLRRNDESCVMQVDYIMAIKLMNPAAYNVDYVFDEQGEDIGWSRQCRKANLRLGWDGRTTSKHVMRPEQLRKVDPRCGF